MSDITTVWSGAYGDWRVVGAQLLAGDDLATATIISLATDRVAHEDDEIPDGTGDPRGWCGDDAANPIGSRLWLLERAVLTQDTLIKAKDYVLEALQWLIDDGVVARIDVLVEVQGLDLLAIQLTYYKQDGSRVSTRFDWAWAGRAS